MRLLKKNIINFAGLFSRFVIHQTVKRDNFCTLQCQYNMFNPQDLNLQSLIQIKKK